MVLPVFVEEVAVAEVGDAGAPKLAEFGERGGLGIGGEEDVDPVAGSFERGAVVGGGEEDDVL